MFEFLKDYESFREQIRAVKVETFNELRTLIDTNDKLKRQLADKDATHEREIMTLSHSLQLERERFALERQTLIAKTERELYAEREKFLERNFADLRDTLTTQHAATKDILSLVVRQLPDVRVRMEGEAIHGGRQGDGRRTLPAAGDDDGTATG